MNAGMTLPRAVIFDMDGLLFDTERIGLMAWEEAASAMGYHFDDAMLFEGIGRPESYMESLLRTYVDEQIDYDSAFALYDAAFRRLIERDGVPVKLGVYKLIDFLSRHDVMRALATSSGTERTEFLLHHARLEDAFDEVITVDMVAHGKPEPDLFLLACESLAVQPEEALVLEDSAPGIIAAHKSGIPAIWVPDLKPIPANVEELAVGTAGSLEDIRRAFSRDTVALTL